MPKNRYGVSLDELGLTMPQISEALQNTSLGGVSGRVAFLDSNFGQVAVKKGHSRRYYDAIQEYTALALVRKLARGIAPVPFYVDISENLLITERILGSPIDVVDDEVVLDLSEKLNVVHSLVFHQARLPHTQRHGSFTPFDRLKQQADFLRDWFSKMNLYTYKKDRGLAKELEVGAAAIIKDAMTSEHFFRERGFVLTHYDINPHNLIRRNGGDLFLIDWGQPYIADAAMDIAKMFYKCELSLAQRELFLSNYHSQTTSLENLSGRIEVYSNLVRLGSYCWRTRVFNEDLGVVPLGSFRNLGEINSKFEDDIKFIRGFQ